ncbi:hypothetical protein BJ508DRAFT_322237 [Ascobolus immersus RN42]|uniref:Uncharacterized protein n=1 Tax=Ascobolus immersus RN42 TaxID=1160509 RepID=A0A3N4IIX9_ASCIM|nr:hypothetical protein BJ508DRAFT_322237 [Ascobolus immersus RN42]
MEPAWAFGKSDERSFEASKAIFKNCAYDLRRAFINTIAMGEKSKLHIHLSKLKKLHNRFMGWAWDSGIFRITWEIQEKCCFHNKPQNWHARFSLRSDYLGRFKKITSELLEISEQQVSTSSKPWTIGDLSWVISSLPGFKPSPDRILQKAFETLGTLTVFSIQAPLNVYGSIRPLEWILVQHHLRLLTTELKGLANTPTTIENVYKTALDLDNRVTAWRRTLWQQHKVQLNFTLCVPGYADGDLRGDFGREMLKSGGRGLVECTLCGMVFNDEGRTSDVARCDREIEIPTMSQHFEEHLEHMGDQNLQEDRIKHLLVGDSKLGGLREDVRNARARLRTRYPCILGCFESAENEDRFKSHLKSHLDAISKSEDLHNLQYTLRAPASRELEYSLYPHEVLHRAYPGAYSRDPFTHFAVYYGVFVELEALRKSRNTADHDRVTLPCFLCGESLPLEGLDEKGIRNSAIDHLFEHVKILSTLNQPVSQVV